MTESQAREIAIRWLRIDEWIDAKDAEEAAAVLEAQANVEEKKAAVIRAAADAVELYLMDEELPADYLTPHIEALRALVEASRESVT